jgi:hypothetical protein
MVDSEDMLALVISLGGARRLPPHLGGNRPEPRHHGIVPLPCPETLPPSGSTFGLCAPTWPTSEPGSIGRNPDRRESVSPANPIPAQGLANIAR